MKSAKFLCGAVITALSALGASATTFPVINGDIVGLKAAIAAANTNGQDDTIELAPHGLYVLTARDNGLNGLPQITSDGGHKLTINGNGSTIQRSTASGIPTFRLLYVASGGNLTITNTVLNNGNSGIGHGGAIYNDGDTASATLTLIGCLVSGCSSDYGGAIYNNGYSEAVSGSSAATLTVSNTTFSSNSGTQYGGAIWTTSGAFTPGVSGSSVLNVNNSTFSQNTAALSAGAVQHDGSGGSATGTIANCTFTQNSAGNYGGAINVDGQGGSDGNGNPVAGSALLNIVNCTFDHNSANWGGGVALDGSNSGGASGNATVKMDSCSFNANSASTLGGGVYLSQTGGGTTSLQIGNTVFAAGASGANFAVDNITGGTAAVSSQGFNLSSDAAGGGAGTAPGGVLNHAGDIRNSDPLFDPAGLKNNGGLTQTIALQAGSPALDQGKSNTVVALTFDQRGQPRPFDDTSKANAVGGDGNDIGAYEAGVRGVTSARNGNDFVITFSTILGHTYQLQYTLSLTPPSWTNLTNTVPAPPIAGTGGLVSVTEPNAFSFSPGFYRLIQLP